jgi:hypothetical protein
VRPSLRPIDDLFRRYAAVAGLPRAISGIRTSSGTRSGVHMANDGFDISDVGDPRRPLRPHVNRDLLPSHRQAAHRELSPNAPLARNRPRLRKGLAMTQPPAILKSVNSPSGLPYSFSKILVPTAAAWEDPVCTSLLPGRSTPPREIAQLEREATSALRHSDVSSQC